MKKFKSKLQYVDITIEQFNNFMDFMKFFDEGFYYGDVRVIWSTLVISRKGRLFKMKNPNKK